MSDLARLIQALILSSIDFLDDELEGLTEKIFEDVTKLVTAGFAFKSDNVDESEAAKAIFAFATKMATSNLTADERTQLKNLFKTFYRGMDESKTTAGVEIFEGTFDLYADAIALNAKADSLQKEVPPVEEV